MSGISKFGLIGFAMVKSENSCKSGGVNWLMQQLSQAQVLSALDPPV